MHKAPNAAKTRRKAMSALAAASVSCAALVGAALPANAAGTWTGQEAARTTVINANTYYYSGTLSAPAGTSGTITSIQYRFDTTYPIPAGHYEALCDTTVGQCADISGMNSGVVTAFAGRPATDKFAFRYINVDRTQQRVSWSLSNKRIDVSYN